MSNLTATQIAEIRNRKLSYNYWTRQYLAHTAVAIAKQRRVGPKTVRKIDAGEPTPKVPAELRKAIEADLKERDRCRAEREKHSMAVVAEEYGKNESTTFNLVSDMPAPTLEDVLADIAPESSVPRKHKPKREPIPLRKLKPEQIKAPLEKPESVQVKWLTKEWGKAA